MLGAVGLLGGLLNKSFARENKLTLILMCIGATFMYETGLYIIQILKYKAIIEIVLFTKILSIEIIYNVILAVIFYPLIKRIRKMYRRKF